MQDKKMEALNGIYSSVDSVIDGLLGKLYEVYKEGAGALHIEAYIKANQSVSDESAASPGDSDSSSQEQGPENESNESGQAVAFDEAAKESKQFASSDDDDDDGSDENNNSGSADTPSITDPKDQVAKHFNDAIAALSALRDEVGSIFNQTDARAVSTSSPFLGSQGLIAPTTEPETFE